MKNQSNEEFTEHNGFIDKYSFRKMVMREKRRERKQKSNRVFVIYIATNFNNRRQRNLVVFLFLFVEREVKFR